MPRSLVSQAGPLAMSCVLIVDATLNGFSPPTSNRFYYNYYNDDEYYYYYTWCRWSPFIVYGI
jgi:hypothetical protein